MKRRKKKSNVLLVIIISAVALIVGYYTGLIPSTFLLFLMLWPYSVLVLIALICLILGLTLPSNIKNWWLGYLPGAYFLYFSVYIIFPDLTPYYYLIVAFFALILVSSFLKLRNISILLKALLIIVPTILALLIEIYLTI